MSINEYVGFFSDFYDVLHSKCTDAEVYKVLLAPYGPSVLELGSGTGRVAIPLAEAGFTVFGVESEPDMIAQMEKKDYPRDKLTVVRGDARRFKLDRAFDSILLSCNFINHFLDSGDLLDCLSGCQKHLRPGGLMVIDTSAPNLPEMVRTNGQTMVTDYPTGEDTFIRCHFTATYDFVTQVERDTIRLQNYQGNTLLQDLECGMTLTYYHPREIRSLAHQAGFRVLDESGHLPLDGIGSHIDENSESIVFLCTK